MTAYGYGQHALSGKVFDVNTLESLAFANIIFNNNPLLQTNSDINGNFSFKLENDITFLSCSFVGYDAKQMKIDSTANENILVGLKLSVNTLNEVSVYPGENPAIRILKKVIENKNSNNPENIASFSYQCYNKLIADFKLNNQNEKDRFALEKFMKGKHLMVMESVTKRNFIAPDLSEEEVLASKVSGFKNPMFASVATEMQPFAFYQDDIKLLNIHYLNPISKGSLKKYKLRIEDTYMRDQDTVFVISFKPYPKKNFEGLQGLLYINSNKYALQNVIATPYEKGTISLKIQQQYQLIDGKYWFPEQLNYVLQLEQYPEKNLGIIMEGKSYLKNIKLNIPLRKKDFSIENIHIAPDATRKDSLFWNQARNEKLDSKELRTYVFLDSLGQKKHFDRYLTLVEKLTQNKVAVSFIDIDLSKTFLYNKYEGSRLGTGIYTNELLSKKFNFGGFFGYGTQDENWKYGYGTNIFLAKKNEISINIKHQNNLIEIGKYGLHQYKNRILSFKDYVSYLYDNVHQNSIGIRFRTWRYLTSDISINSTSIKSLHTNVTPEFSTIRNTDIQALFRFAFKEKIVQFLSSTYSAPSKYPIAYFFLSKGIKSLFNGNLDYTKLELAVEQTVYLKNIGEIHYRIEAGYIDKITPTGLRFTGEGNYDKNFPYVAKNTFQTMTRYEFLSDRYLHLFLSHNFGTLLLKTKYFQPSFSVHNNLGWGTTIATLPKELSFFKTKEKIYAEVGLHIDNVFKINIQRLGYFGIGVATYNRYGYYAMPDFKDNQVYNITFQFTIK